MENGILYHGYHFGGLGAFTYYDNEYHFANDIEAEDELKKAAERGGSGFMQHMIMDDGKIVCIPMYKQRNKRRIYRMLAEHDHKICIIDSKKPVVYREFANAVANYGAEHALFMDNGHWSYAWYRDNSGNTKTMVGLPWPLSDNWIVFRRG